jgi:hypothetical protein
VHPATNDPAAFSGFLLLSSAAAPAGAQPVCATNHYRFEEGAANAAASGTGTLLDSVGSAGGGTPFEGPIYRPDLPTPVVQNTGVPNTLSLELSGSQSAQFPSRFIFHQGYGDATLEFFLKAPEQGHNSIFWTRAGDDDANRFNITVNSSGGFGFDYRSPDGTLHIPSASQSLFFIPLNSWHHVAVVRRGTTYSFYLDGAFQTSRTDVSPDLPTSSEWSISGRSGYRLAGLVDEIRFSDCALAPHQFLISGCSPNCDGSTVPPVLNVADFICFQSKFAAADPYANCDGSTVSPTLNVADFICFQSRFAAGCP